MEEFYIEVLKWSQVNSAIKKINPELFKILNAIAVKLQSKNIDYVYRMKFRFGEKIIDNGQMTAIARGTNGLLSKNLIIKGDSKSNLKQISQEQFIKDCGKDSDHPLSLVLENYIEIYHKHKSSYTEIGEYNFPLDILNRGDLFGVFGAINNFNGCPNLSLNPWNAVAGKACIIPLFPEPTLGKASNFYKSSFFKIFNTEQVDTVQAIYDKFNSIYADSWKTEILMIPSAYYLIDEKFDSIELRVDKVMLQNYLFKIGWEQSQKFREWHWEDKSLTNEIWKNEYQKQSLVITLVAKHLIRLVQNKSYCLKLVDADDKELFEVFKILVSDFKNEKVKRKDLLSYSFPGFLHYDKFQNIKSHGIELLHSPSVNLCLPEFTIEELRKNIIRDIYGTELHKIIKQHDNKIKISYFLIAPNKDSNLIFDRQHFIDKILSDFYKSELGGRKIILTKPPMKLNGFVLFTKIIP